MTHSPDHRSLAMMLHRQGRTQEAIAAFGKAIAASPTAQGFDDFANFLVSVGRPGEAIHALAQAAALEPNVADRYYNFANGLASQGKWDEAIAAYHRAIALRPNFVEAISNLGSVYQGLGKLDDAIGAFGRAVALRPNAAELYLNLANVLNERGRIDEAIDAYRRLVALRPSVEAFNTFGTILQGAQRWDDAAAAYRQSMAMQPEYVKPRLNLGLLLRERGRMDEAIAVLREAMARHPSDPDIRFNLGLLLLITGNLAEGWPLYEARWEMERVPEDGGMRIALWSGADLAGRRILLRAEQGFGDLIQFVRYAPMVAARGGRVIVHAPKELHRLLEGRCNIESLIATGDVLRDVDVQFPLVSLPGLFGTTLDTIPAATPYLFAKSPDVLTWRCRLGSAPTGRLKVGLAWAGSPTQRIDRERSPHLPAMAPLAEAKDVQFFSLQIGDAAREAQSLPAGLKLIDLTQHIHDFADTAALMMNLNLIITSDTSVAHLAGALGRPVWVALSFSPDWRWLLNRSDSPWYPTMRLFRQPTPGDWKTPMTQIARELAKVQPH